MQPLQMFASKLRSEIDQKEILQKNLILKVLSSKRLLIDHVEIIEEVSFNSLLSQEKPTEDLITFLGTSSVVATSCAFFVFCKQKYLIPCISGVIPLLYAQKLVNIKKRQFLEAKLSTFIISLDNYESAIKKNKMFLQEAQMIKSSSSILKRYDRDNKMPCNLLGSIKNVINALYIFVKKLETYPIAGKLSMIYEPFEDLRDCDLMTMNLEDEFDLKIIKDFFNIFAYVQSQTLLRFSLITVSNCEDISTILDEKLVFLTDVIRTETSNISKFLDIINNVSQIQTNIQKQIDNEISMTMPKELREVRSGSIKFSAKVLTVAMQCQQLEELIIKFAQNFEHPDNKDIEEIITVMKVLENEMSVSIDEHKRIAISFQKYLNMEIEEPKIPQETLDGASDITTVQQFTGNDVTVQVDDFFFVDGKSPEIDEDVKDQQHETIEEVNSKLAKKYFKPVLIQLKERIEVIGEDMKEREKKVLKAKGIEIQNEPEVSDSLLHKDNDDDESGSDDERERQRKIRRSQKKFNDNREFLESKEPVNFFSGLQSSLKNCQTLDEDILE